MDFWKMSSYWHFYNYWSLLPFYENNCQGSFTSPTLRQSDVCLVGLRNIKHVSLFIYSKISNQSHRTKGNISHHHSAVWRGRPGLFVEHSRCRKLFVKHCRCRRLFVEHSRCRRLFVEHSRCRRLFVEHRRCRRLFVEHRRCRRLFVEHRRCRRLFVKHRRCRRLEQRRLLSVSSLKETSQGATETNTLTVFSLVC